MKWPLQNPVPEIKAIPVLRYHKVWEGAPDALTISPKQLSTRLGWLYASGFRALHLAEFIAMAQGELPVDHKSFLLTFDDGYLNQCAQAYPILRAFQFPATFFINGNSLDGTGAIAFGAEQKATVADLALLDPAVVQLALYSHGDIHHGFDLYRSIQIFTRSGLPFFPVLAYTHGDRRSKAGALAAWKQEVAQAGILAAFRTGSRFRRLSPADRYELSRIDIPGTDTLEHFVHSIRKGRSGSVTS
jgi:hypothetical protein